MDLRMYFMMFITYSFIGWIIEVINIGFETKKIVNRGFLIGPYCPIYGCGSLIMTLLLDTSKNDLSGVFLKAVFICAILEYTTSYIMEKMFKTRWWDYSNKKFNINGRICLETLFLFGLGGVFLVYITSPLMIKIYSSMPNILLTIISITLSIIFLSDAIVSFNIINSVKNKFSNARKDSTEEIVEQVKKALSTSYFKTRLLESFPNLKIELPNIKNKDK